MNLSLPCSTVWLSVLVTAMVMLESSHVLSQDGCPCTNAPKEFDLFKEEAGQVLRTLCVIGDEPRDPKLPELYDIIEDLMRSDVELRSHSNQQRDDTALEKTSGIKISSIPALNLSSNVFNETVCDATLSIISDRKMNDDEKRNMRIRHYRSCPGVCLVVPHIEIPSSIIEAWLHIGRFWSLPLSQRLQIG